MALHRIFAHLLSISAARGPSFDPVAYVDGLENPTENFANICGWLVQHGYDDTDRPAPTRSYGSRRRSAPDNLAAPGRRASAVAERCRLLMRIRT